MAIIGTLNQVDMPGVVELARQMRSARLRLMHGRNEWAIYIQDNEVVHAQTNTADGPTGIDVFHEAMSCPEGVFVLEENVRAPSITIETSWNNLLVAGLQRMDEAGMTDIDGRDEIQEPPESGLFIVEDMDEDDSLSITYEDGHMIMTGLLDEENTPRHVIKIAQRMNEPTRVRLRHGRERYEAYVARGRVKHAQSPIRRGIDAFQNMMALNEGQFRLEQGHSTDETSISADWGALWKQVDAHLKMVNERRTQAASLLRRMAGDIGSGVITIALLEPDGRQMAAFGTCDPAVARRISVVIHAGRSTTDQHVKEVVMHLEREVLLGMSIIDGRYLLFAQVNPEAMIDSVQMVLTSYLRRLRNLLTEPQ